LSLLSKVCCKQVIKLSTFAGKNLNGKEIFSEKKNQDNTTRVRSIFSFFELFFEELNDDVNLIDRDGRMHRRKLEQQHLTKRSCSLRQMSHCSFRRFNEEKKRERTPFQKSEFGSSAANTRFDGSYETWARKKTLSSLKLLKDQQVDKSTRSTLHKTLADR